MSIDSELLERDIAARADALDVTRSFIVQAPAGSGKTGLLIQRYLRLLATVDAPEEILAITFTKKAALEMRFRIVNALRQAAEGVVGQSDHESHTLSLAADVLARDRDREWRLLASPGRMRIDTVDAFCAGVARSLPLSSGLGGIGQTLADAEMTLMYQEAAAATLDYLAGAGDSRLQVERLLEHLDNDTGLYVSHLARMLASREQWLGITGSGPAAGADIAMARVRLERNIADVIDRHLARLDEHIPSPCREDLPPLLDFAAQNLLAAGRTEHPLTGFENVTSLPAPVSAHRLEWVAIANLLLTGQATWRKSVNKNDGFPPEGKALKERLSRIIDSLRDHDELRVLLDRTRRLPPPRYSDEQWRILLALFELLPMAVAELRRLFAERGVTDHGEVSMAAGRALGNADAPGDIALMLDYRIRHLLVDEMQDTSIAQYGLLQQLTMGWNPGDGRTMFCVGDPMQSIYRFRDAEVGEFLLARQRGIGGIALTPLTLRRNFRSGEHLVHWFNTVFEQVMPEEDDIVSGEIAYSTSVPVDAAHGVGEFHLHALIDGGVDDEAKTTLDVIARCLEESAEGDVAVLVRSRTHLSGLLRSMRHAGIEYQSVEIDRLTDLPEVIDMIALTRALCHEADRIAWLAVLRGPWCGLRWCDIHALVRNDTGRTVPELVASDRRVATLSDDGQKRLHSVFAALEPYVCGSATRTLRDRVEAAWCALGGPAALAEPGQVNTVYRYLDILERIEVAGTLDDIRQLEARLDQERVSSAGSAACRVQIMTMHKAKGLEFDHVVLHGLGRVSRGATRDVLSWLNIPDESGSSEIILSPVGPRGSIESDPLHQYIVSTDDDKSRAELDRLLYVACTRARKSLDLVGNVGVTSNGERLRSPDRRSLLSRLWPAISAGFERAFAEWSGSDGTDAEDVDDYLVLPTLRRFAESWKAPDVAGLPGRVADEADHGDPEKAVEYYWVGSAARHAGTIVHRWLQRMSEGRVSMDVAEIASLRDTSCRWASSFGVADTDMEPVWARVERALKGILDDDRGRWLLDGEGESELRLTGLVDQRIESIVIDRVRIDDDGTHWIVDYKTSTHEGGDLDGFLKQEADRYRPQLAKYATVYASLTGQTPRTALYFPLIREFSEVEV